MSRELDILRLQRLKRLAELQKKAAEMSKGVEVYFNDPVGFARDCIDWGERGLNPYQADIMELLAKKRRASFRSLRGAGKSCTAAITILWFAITREAAKANWKVVTTAGSWGQLIHYLWPEIHKWAGRIRWDKVRGGRKLNRQELQRITLRLEYGEAMACASQNSGLIEGAHADELLFVFDEAKLIPASTFDSAEGAMNTGNCYALMLSTPGEPSGRFYEIQSGDPRFKDWGIRAVKLHEVLDSGTVNREWVEARRLQWGEESALFQNHVLGEFYASDEHNVIPLAWAEAAVDRWKQWDAAGRPPMPGHRVVSCDVAREGVDKTCIMVRQGWMIHEIHQRSKQDTMRTAGEVKAFTRHPYAIAVVDTIGIGAGVADRLREEGVPTYSFVASAGARWRDGRPMTDRSGEYQFANVRAAAWWFLREALDVSYYPRCSCPKGDPENRNCWKCTGAIGFPDDPQLLGDLTAPTWDIMGNAKIAIEKKDKIKERIGRSTDKADALVMAAWYSGGVAEEADDLLGDKGTFDYFSDEQDFADETLWDDLASYQ